MFDKNSLGYFLSILLGFSLCSILVYALIYYDTNELNLLDIRTSEGNLAGLNHMNKETGEKLVTIFTTFIDESGITNYDYRYLVQFNFIRMTKFTCFKDVQFIIYTNSRMWKKILNEENLNIHVFPTNLRGDFKPPMFKDAFETAMKTTNSFFYMQVNSCNLYDSSLIRTLEKVREAWKTGQIRQKIKISGQRSNLPLQKIVQNEEEFLTYFEEAELYHQYALDYIIVTKDTIEWELFPEILLGRIYSDGMIIDHAIHNEIELVDATKTIRLLHRTEANKSDSSQDERNDNGNNWNAKLSQDLRDHYSITCARYYSNISSNGNQIEIFDKKKDSKIPPISKRNRFLEQHEYWVDYNGDRNETSNSISPSLIIILLAYNKPQSLERLFNSLAVSEFRGERIDLITSLDIGLMGYFDLPTLILVKELSWKHGKKKVVLKNRHSGQLYQWIEADSCMDADEDVPFIILEDSIVLSPNWYDYLMAVMQYSKNTKVDEQIVGWTLEAPIVSRNPSSTLKMFTKLYADKSSVVKAGIKRVRSFVPVRKTWTQFIEWFMKESHNVPVNEIVGSYVDQLENKGNWTNWETHMWHPWFRYFVKSDGIVKDQIMFIFDRWGTLAQKKFPKLVFENEENCYDSEVIVFEHELEEEHDLGNQKPPTQIQLPETIDIFDYEKDLAKVI